MKVGQQLSLEGAELVEERSAPSLDGLIGVRAERQSQEPIALLLELLVLFREMVFHLPGLLVGRHTYLLRHESLSG